MSTQTAQRSPSIGDLAPENRRAQWIGIVKSYPSFFKSHCYAVRRKIFSLPLGSRGGLRQYGFDCLGTWRSNQQPAQANRILGAPITVGRGTALSDPKSISSIATDKPSDISPDRCRLAWFTGNMIAEMSARGDEQCLASENLCTIVSASRAIWDRNGRNGLSG